jgi:hypothetical protein
MPTDPRGWLEEPLDSTYPACIAVKAAQQQGPEAGSRYLRTLREGIIARARKLDGREALVREARGAGLDVERFRADLGSRTVVEAFDADVAEARSVPDVAREADKVRCSQPAGVERVAFPTLRFSGPDGEHHWTCGSRPLDYVRAKALAAGASARPGARPDPLAAIQRFGRMAVVEVSAVCDRPLPSVEAELAQLALERRIRPIPVLGGRLWEVAG